MESPYSPSNPYLQTALDSTSLGEFKICPRRYQYSILQGFTPRSESVHLVFGLLCHGAIEQYQHHRLTLDHEEALGKAVHWLLKATWRDGRPWQSDDPNKNRLTLIRSVVWYLDKYKDDPLSTVSLTASGKPAVELSFRFHSGYEYKSTKDNILFCGHLDRLVTGLGGTWITDIKTTKYTINQSWFNKFTPHNQFSIYSLAGKICFQQETKGIICDGWQILVNSTNFERQLIERNDFQISEWLRDQRYWLDWIDNCATEQYWPQNDKACDLFGGCPFREVCSQKSLQSQQALLQGTFKKRVWNPLENRGDI